MDPTRVAERRAARKLRRAAVNRSVKAAIGAWRDDHKIDPDEVPAIRAAAGKVLLAAGAVAVDALDGAVSPVRLRKLRDTAVSFIVVVSAALED